MVTYHPEVDQGSPEWLAMRCGLLTASEMKLIVTPGTLKAASNEKERAHLYELAAQRINKYVEPTYIGDDMLRGMSDEIDARILYDKEIAPTQTCGFITNDKWGFTIGYSPDWLVGDDGQAECKSRRQKFQMQTMLENVIAAEGATIPTDYVVQCQTGLAVSERKWLDFCSYCGGMPMIVLRVWPDDKVQAAIIEAAQAFEERMTKAMANYDAALSGRTVYANRPRLFPTERKPEMGEFM